MGADFLFVGEKLGFFKFTDQIAQLDQRGGAGVFEVALRRSMPIDQGAFAQIEHGIELILHRLRIALKINRARHLAGAHASAVAFASVQIDLEIR